MRTWRDLGTAGRVFVAGCLALAALVVGAVWWIHDPDVAPEAFEQRTPAVSCGTVRVFHELPRGPEIACFVEALRTGADAEVVVRGSSPEGGAYALYYRTMPGRGGLEYFADSEQDGFGSGRWEHYRCPDARNFVDLGTCQDL